ncbi:MAG: hypothetical protein E1N59_1676 [Puniceicoccaceae bacterium 5H]|nr:MAG: hypothetical protein E1N59_1676 [Puniceicoccaceae bacterium 5H]
MKAWSALLVGLVAGTVLGGAVAYSLQAPGPEPVEPAEAAAQDDGQDWTRLVAALDNANVELAQANRRIAALEDEMLRLQEGPADAEDVPSELQAAAEANGLTPDQQRRYERMLRGASRRMDWRLREVGQIAELEPWQQERIEFMTQQIQQAMQERLLARARGEETDGPNPMDQMEQELANILTPEQLADYNAYQADLQQGRLETMSNATMSRLSAGLGLDEQQKDQLYSAVYRAAETTFADDNEDGGPDFDSFGSTLLNQLEQTLPANEYEQIRQRLENSNFGGRGGPRR